MSFRAFSAPRPQRSEVGPLRAWLYLGPAAMLAGLILFTVFAGKASRAAQIEHTTWRPVKGWVVTEFFAHPEKHGRAWRDLSDPGEAFETRQLCEQMVPQYPPIASGSRVRCTFVDDIMVVR